MKRSFDKERACNWKKVYFLQIGHGFAKALLGALGSV